MIIEDLRCLSATISVVTENLPEATLAFDRFHIVKLFNDRISDVRRKLYQRATGALEKKVLKGNRWLLLKNPENLRKKNDENDERQQLREALELNQPLVAGLPTI